MKPAVYDFSVVRGTAGPRAGLVWRLKAGPEDAQVNIPFDDVRLTIYQRNTLVLRATLGNAQLIVSNPSEAEITWSPTASETRSLPLGAKSRYELEVWNGTDEIVYVMGTITGIGGINDDIGDGDYYE